MLKPKTTIDEMIKLLENGTLHVLRTYANMEEVKFDLIHKKGGECLVEYNNNIYGVKTFLENIND